MGKSTATFDDVKGLVKEDKRSKNYNKNRQYLIAAAVVVAISTFVALGLSVFSSNTESTIGIQHGLSTLRSVQASDYLHLKGKMFGTKTEGNSTVDLDLFVKTDSIDESNTEDIWNGKLDMFASYVAESIRYNITMVNSRGYYISENTTGFTVTNVACIDQDSMPPLSTSEEYFQQERNKRIKIYSSVLKILLVFNK